MALDYIASDPACVAGHKAPGTPAACFRSASASYSNSCAVTAKPASFRCAIQS